MFFISLDVCAAFLVIFSDQSYLCAHFQHIKYYPVLEVFHLIMYMEDLPKLVYRELFHFCSSFSCIYHTLYKQTLINALLDGFQYCATTDNAQISDLVNISSCKHLGASVK